MRRSDLQRFALIALGALAGCRDATEPLVPASLQVAAGDGQTAAVGTPLAVAPAVRVLAANGKPVRDVTVTFAVSGGGGNLATLTAATDRNGTATAAGWTMGTTAGENLLTASSGTLVPVTIRASAVAGPPAGLRVVREPAAAAIRAAPLPTQPVVQLVDGFGNTSALAGITVSAVVVEGAPVANGSAVTAADGTAAFSGLALDAPAGSYTLEFRAPGLSARRAAGPIIIGTGICGDAGAGAVSLDFQPDQWLRVSADAPTAPTCLSFELSRAAGQQYLLLFENMPLNGAFTAGVFDELPRSPTGFTFAVRGAPSVVGPAGLAAAFRSYALPPIPDPVAAGREWDFGDGPIREGAVGPLPAQAAEPKLLRQGVALSLLAADADPQVGDTISVYLEGVPRLSIPDGQQQAVIRAVSSRLIFAEDVRLGTTLLREGSTPEVPLRNTPLTQADMDSIAAQYDRFAAVQGDLLFQGRFNQSIESRSPAGRVLAVHTLMYANNIWGYTYSSAHYFAFDYWVGTNGSTRQLAQHPQRVADDLFMHEIAHLRHYGMLERAGRTAQRGNQWLVEGFARFTERLPIANRLLGPVQPSRTGNVVLPRNPAFENSYYFDDVPTYLQAGAAMFGGYGASAYVFDYFADQVALAGGDPLAALRDFLLNGGTRAGLDTAVARWLTGVGSFAELFTRARVALYTDDYGAGPLPAWTQYQQFQLRASRPPGSQSGSDPRNAWLKVQPGQPFSTEPADLAPGTASGLLIDGTSATGSARISIDAPRVPNGVISIVRIR